MRLFELHRDEDATGTSGTGVVAQGVQFDNGYCALTWLSHFAPVAVYHSIDVLENIHGHGGKTRVVWVRPLHQKDAEVCAAFDAWCAVEDEKRDEGLSFERLYDAIDSLRSSPHHEYAVGQLSEAERGGELGKPKE